MKLSSKLILASGSPRRKQLLENAGFQFEVKSVSIDEIYPEDLEVSKVAQFLAVAKNEANRKLVRDEIVLTADTVVVHANQILGKPNDIEEAAEVLKQLSGQIHEVITGVCISSPQKSVAFSSTTQVKFKVLDVEQIDYYVRTYQPLDKAGSYAIQEWIGLIGVEWIKGSFYNVVGLPVDRVYDELRKNF